MATAERPPVGPGPPTEERYSASNPGLALFGVALIVGAVGIAWILTSAAGAPIRLLLIGGVLVFLILMLSRAVLILGPTALTVALGPWVWELIEIKYSEIDSAEVVQAKTLGYGGYGWPFRRAILVRAGDAVRINRRNKMPFVVTVDGALRAVETIQERAAPRGTQ